VVATSGVAQGHRLDGRQTEALVEAGYDEDLGRAEQRDQVGFADAGDEADGVLQAEAVEGALRRTPSLALPTRTNSTSRSVRSLAIDSSSGTSPFIGTSLAVATIRPRARGSVGGWKTSVSPPTGTP
jgi:hypothetical protein